MSYAVGSLVRARGREWVVLPESAEDFLVLRPLGGTEDEVAGVLPALELVEHASFPLPDPHDLNELGDYRSGRLLREALRLGFRSAAGPFRSFGSIAVEPRPYQLIPLLMALKLDPVRLLIADDVGIGKTIEAGLVARELLDRGEAERLAVLCPPQLAEQWQQELAQKFHLEAELVLPSTASRLERDLRLGQSLFEVYPYVVVSTDFIKSDRRRDEFLNSCPELVIIDEAHTCAYAAEGRGGQHQRHQLAQGLAARRDRHLILVTATPHSGKEEAFRSLLALLDPDFAHLPPEPAGPANEHQRRRLAAHFVQRRRADIRQYMGAQTDFPEREEREASYALADEYKRLFRQVLEYARETVTETTGDRRHQRVRWWSALALLRSLASSPAAASATLRTRAAGVDTDTAEEADEIGRRTVLDLMDASADEGTDVIPGSDAGEAAGEALPRERLLRMARAAEALRGDKDAKLTKAVGLVRELLDEGFQPIVFCRFIPTAEYVAEEFRRRLGTDTEVAAVTGQLPPPEREVRVAELASPEHPRRVLVCTDCLSEGINLQEHFDAVLHYDLSWNPTRHEQREGRVDRYGQKRPIVRVLTYYGTDNQIDGIVLDVLIRKHNAIRNSLGISVPVPVDTEQVVEAIFEGLLLREGSGGGQQLTFLEELLGEEKAAIHAQWDRVSEREKRSRTMFAQESIKVEEVARELHAVQAAVGAGTDVRWFLGEALRANGAVVSGDGSVAVELGEVPRAVREAMGLGEEMRFRARFEPPVGEQDLLLTRAHPLVEGLAAYVLDTALDPLLPGIARRLGAIRTTDVAKRTTLLLLRSRLHIEHPRAGDTRRLLAEDAHLVAFAGSPEAPEWLDTEGAERLLLARPAANVAPEIAAGMVAQVVEGIQWLWPKLEEIAVARAGELADAHRRVRAAARVGGPATRVEAQLPPDLLGVYVYLPVVK